MHGAITNAVLSGGSTSTGKIAEDKGKDRDLGRKRHVKRGGKAVLKQKWKTSNHPDGA